MNTFQMLTDDLLANNIRNANRRVVYIAPGIWSLVAEAITDYKNQKPEGAIEIILDSDAQIYRLGYGNIEAMKHLEESNILLRKCLGIRVGLLIVDEEAWVFTPVPRLIEQEPRSKSEFAPNSISISIEKADNLLKAIAPELVIDEMINQNIASKKSPVVSVPKPEIALDFFCSEDIEGIQHNLLEFPPQQFDLARQVNVYSSYIQFVELSLEGTHLARHTVAIPQDLLNLVTDEKEETRLKASYQLIRSDSDISGKAIQNKVKKLREKYLKPLGNSYGTVILKKRKDEFCEDIEKLKKELDEFKENVQSKLEEEFKICSNTLTNILEPAIERNPPQELLNGIMGSNPTKLQIKKYLNDKLDRIIPSTDDFVKDMVIQYRFKEVTYEMLHEESFIKNLKKAFPYADLPDIPIDEYKAVRTK